MSENMEHICPYCNQELKSEKAYNSHLAIYHDKLKSGEDIEDFTRDSLNKISDRSLLLMVRFPACRKPTPKHIWGYYIRIFGINKIFVWDQASQEHQYRDRERTGIKFTEFEDMLEELEEVRRTAQKHRANDKKNHMKDGTQLPHICILPSDEDMHKATVRERAIRRWAVQGELSNTIR